MLSDSLLLLVQHAKLDIRITVLIARLDTIKFLMDTAYLVQMSVRIALSVIMARLALFALWVIKIIYAAPVLLDTLLHLLLPLLVLLAHQQ